MSNDLTHWLSGGRGLDRQQDRELAAVEHAADVAEAQIAGINRATQRALLETLRSHLLKQQAEHIAPDGAELYAMIAVAGAVGSAKVIDNLSRRCGRL